MDASKTGGFISQQRKSKELTQKQLAKMLDVSDKTISRWETGKGYPDVETLPRLADCLGVTITEILSGEKSKNVADERTERAVYDVCSTAIEAGVRRKKKISSLKIALVAVSIMLAASLMVSFFTTAMIREYNSIVGSENCVIANDYSKLNYFGMVYLPIIVSKSTGIEPSDKVLVEEAQVEGYGYLAKLPFGETIYAVNGFENNELIYLQTNGLVGYSRFFCRQDKYNEYRNVLEVENYVPSECFISIDGWEPRRVEIEQKAVNYLTRLKKSDNGIAANEIASPLVYEIDLYTFEYCPINLGTFKVTKDAIYFCPSTVFAENKEGLYYKTGGSFDDYFQQIFSNDNEYKTAIGK